jgi:ferredoxin--NADP+ reductase
MTERETGPTGCAPPGGDPPRPGGDRQRQQDVPLLRDQPADLRQVVPALRGRDAITDVAGPLGRPTELRASGHAVCVGGGVGTAVVYPIAQALAGRGVKVTSVIGGRSKEWVIYEDELWAAGEGIVCTDDGTYGRHGFVTEGLNDLCEVGGIDEVFAVGPVPMMRACSELTRPHGVKTTVSLNAIMVDGTGMWSSASPTHLVVGGWSRSPARSLAPVRDGRGCDRDKVQPAVFRHLARSPR